MSRKTKTPAPEAAPTKRVAVLDENNRLIGATEVAMDAPGIDVGDLPTDGSYFHDPARGCFLPLGYGLEGRVARPPCSTELVLAEVVKLLGNELSPTARSWLSWYEANGQARDQGRVEFRRLLQKRKRAR